MTCFFDSCADNNTSKILLFLSLCYKSKLLQDTNQSWAGGNLAACELRMRSCQAGRNDLQHSTPHFVSLAASGFFLPVCLLFIFLTFCSFSFDHTTSTAVLRALFFSFFFLIFRISWLINTHTYGPRLIWAICHPIMTKISLLSILYLFIIIFNSKEELKKN
jgi:hypothetical protein